MIVEGKKELRLHINLITPTPEAVLIGYEFGKNFNEIQIYEPYFQGLDGIMYQGDEALSKYGKFLKENFILGGK